MLTATPLFDLIVHFRKYQLIPDEWIRRFSTRGDLDEAARAAWQAETVKAVVHAGSLICAARYLDLHTATSHQG
jgi:hypothetical protein